MMSSGTSTDTSTFRPWHLFLLGGLLAATGAALLSRQADPEGLILLSLAIGAAALAGLGLYRTLWPLAVAEFTEAPEMVGGRTRAAVEREKTLVLRSIKELEFDHAMGKVSDSDFQDMARRLRGRAITLMKQLDIAPGYRDLIERELEGRLRQSTVDGPRPQVATPRKLGAEDRVPATEREARPDERPACGECGTANDSDARFCKSCGSVLL